MVSFAVHLCHNSYHEEKTYHANIFLERWYYRSEFNPQPQAVSKTFFTMFTTTGVQKENIPIPTTTGTQENELKHTINFSNTKGTPQLDKQPKLHASE
mmetsp:Transcript_11643/g.15386  ORF Transcript_11643/g.15386 Transcript_11643/m.15386 type:complete len:98 (-) Transcript_11643:33-326(-)